MLDSLSDKRILVTGASGFTGCHLKVALEALGANSLNLSGNKCANDKFVYADLGDKTGLIKIVGDFSPDYVIHLAAISFVDHQPDLDFYKVNVLGTQNLLDSMIAARVSPKKVLIASSANVYGTNVGINLSEEDSCNPVNHYALSKLAMEKLAETYYDKLELIVTRPFNYTGPAQREEFVVPKIVSHFKQRKHEIELGNVDVARDFSSVDFIVESYLRLLISDCASQVINVCSGRLTSLQDVIGILEKFSGYKIKVKLNPNFVRENEIRKIAGSNNKLFSMIGKLKIAEFENVLKEMYDA